MRSGAVYQTTLVVGRPTNTENEEGEGTRSGEVEGEGGRDREERRTEERETVLADGQGTSETNTDNTAMMLKTTKQSISSSSCVDTVESKEVLADKTGTGPEDRA